MRKTNTASRNKTVSLLLGIRSQLPYLDCPVPFEAISSRCDLSLSDVLLYIMQSKLARPQKQKAAACVFYNKACMDSCNSDRLSY